MPCRPCDLYHSFSTSQSLWKNICAVNDSTCGQSGHWVHPIGILSSGHILSTDGHTCSRLATIWWRPLPLEPGNKEAYPTTLQLRPLWASLTIAKACQAVLRQQPKPPRPFHAHLGPNPSAFGFKTDDAASRPVAPHCGNTRFSPATPSWARPSTPGTTLQPCLSYGPNPKRFVEF